MGHGQGLRGGPGRAGSPDGRVRVCRLPGTLPSICPASPATLTLTGKGRGLGLEVLEAHQGLLRTWLLWSPPSLLLDLLGHPRSRDTLSFLPPRKTKAEQASQLFVPLLVLLPPRLLVPGAALPTLSSRKPAPTGLWWEPRASSWTSPRPRQPCHATLPPPVILDLRTAPRPTCPHLFLGGLLPTSSDPQRQTSHLGF